jgi:hypothetical protein
MPSYLVETYLARKRANERDAVDRRVRKAARELSRSSAPVRFDGSILVPEDEICFFVFEAPSGRAAANAAARAGLDAIRVVEVSAREQKEER